MQIHPRPNKISKSFATFRFPTCIHQNLSIPKNILQKSKISKFTPNSPGFYIKRFILSHFYIKIPISCYLSKCLSHFFLFFFYQNFLKSSKFKISKYQSSLDAVRSSNLSSSIFTLVKSNSQYRSRPCIHPVRRKRKKGKEGIIENRARVTILSSYHSHLIRPRFSFFPKSKRWFAWARWLTIHIILFQAITRLPRIPSAYTPKRKYTHVQRKASLIKAGRFHGASSTHTRAARMCRNWRLISRNKRQRLSCKRLFVRNRIRFIRSFFERNVRGFLLSPSFRAKRLIKHRRKANDREIRRFIYFPEMRLKMDFFETND